MARSYLNETNANTYSNFNAENNFAIDTFPEYRDLTADEYVLADELHNLAKKTNKTPTEIDRQNYLATLLESTIPRAIDSVNMACALINTQKQVKESIVPYVESKKVEITNLVETKKTEISTAKDNALIDIEQKKNNVIEYMDTTTAGAIRNDIGVMGDSTVTGANLVEKTNNLKSAIDGKASGTDLTSLQDSIDASLGDMTTVSTTSKTASGAIIELNTNKVSNTDLDPKTTGGSATTYTITLNNPNLSQFIIVPHIDCGATPTLSINGGAALTIVKQDGSTVSSGDIKANKPLSLVRVGSNFFIRNGGGSIIKSSQKLTVRNTTTLFNATISPVDLSKAVVFNVGASNNQNSSHIVGGEIIELTSATNVKISSYEAPSLRDTSFQVIEFNNLKSLQRGTVKLYDSANTNFSFTSLDVSISGVDISKCMLIVQVQYGSANKANIRIDFKDSTTLTVTGKNNSDGTSINYQIVEFN